MDVAALDGDLDLQLAAAEAEVHDGLTAAGLAVGRGEVPGHAPGPGGAPVAGLVLLHLVVARDAQVDLALADEGGDVGRGEEDERDGQVLDESDVESVLPPELDVGALEQVKRRLLQPALWRVVSCVSWPPVCGLRCLRGWGAGAETYSWARRRAAGLLGFANTNIVSRRQQLPPPMHRGPAVGSASLERGTRAYWLTKSMAKDVPAAVSGGSWQLWMFWVVGDSCQWSVMNMAAEDWLGGWMSQARE